MNAFSYPLPFSLLPCPRQDRDRGAQVGVRRVEEFDDERMAVEDVLHHAALDAFAAAMDQPDFAQPGRVRRADVLVNDRRNIFRQERVEVEAMFDRDVRSAPSLRS